MFDSILSAFLVILEPANLIAMLGGTLLGICIGALPGLSATMGIAVLIPLSFGLDPLVGLGLMAGIYNGAMYGGAIPSILLGVPGTPASVATIFDGRPMAEQGRGKLALRVAVFSSAIGGLISGLVLLLLAPPLARVTLLFGPSDYFWVALFGLSSLSLLLGKSIAKGVFAAGFGLLIGLIGIDTIGGQERFTFGFVELVNGVNIVVVLIGLFGIPPTLKLAAGALPGGRETDRAEDAGDGRLRPYLPQLLPTWLKSSLIGVFVGLLPGVGGNMASFLSYNESKRSARDPARFGYGAEEGVAAAECGNNADNGAALVPALTLGVPGSSVSAVILGGLLVHGLQPGPELFQSNPNEVYGFMLQMVITAALLIPLGLLGSRLFVRVLDIPPALLIPIVLSLSMVGVYAVNNSLFDIQLLLVFGAIGMVLSHFQVPLAPIVLGVLLGPMAEENLRLAFMLSVDPWTALFPSPLSVGLALFTVSVIAFSLLKPLTRFTRARLRRAAAH
ncbi:tripartite tricarboxylate transporter permease [Alloalcanivorax sp. C16-2]|uniref:tripartite tricarboxylate transporter permease n=1 Tax=Alloalcanivorax TaxID=3020832 RepID=UPI0019343AA9|nr:tripartite tricarboxylate transporter permease [Alloalcanivorax marinus]MBL7250510.1 tripartite tricarboxylate transporter permease [Alloalcanivorax marinus]